LSPAIGERYGLLEIVDELPPRLERCGIKTRLVVVRCACGVVKIVRLTNLRSGNTRSCGCWAEALASMRMSARRRSQAAGQP
jgi:hypothetical protein